MRHIRRHRIVLALLSVAVAASLTACGSDAGDDDTAPTDAGAANADAPVSVPEPAADGLGVQDEGGDADSARAVNAVIERSVIATGALRVSTKALDDVRRDAIALVTGLGGHVADEQSRSDGKGRLDRVDLTLRVPAASFDKAMDGLAELGTVRSRQQSVEDVTTQVIDNEARVKAQSASVASIERLLARATAIGEIISIERELANRQAELDSLEQQQKWLADQTSMSTVQLSLTPPAKHDDDSGSGFLGGLEDGWDALGRTTVAVGTALGAVLPFAAVLALIGAPVWLVVRRRRSAPAVAAPSPEA